MKRHIARISKMDSDSVTFKWTISHFSVENLLEGVLKSPGFKSFGRDFHLQVSRNSREIHLRLNHSYSDNPPLISECSIGFYLAPPSIRWNSKTFNVPIKLADISFTLSVETLKKECLADEVLRVGCYLTITKLKHILATNPVAPTAGNEITFSKQGHKTLAENLGNILEDLHFSDVTLKVEEETFQAHKAILASRSKVFDGMFKSSMKESQETVVEIAEMKPPIIREMLQYIYAGTIGNLSMDAAIDLYVGSDRYDLQELKGWCKEFILEHISSDDVCRVAVIADLHSDEELAKASRRVFKEDPKTIIESETWRDFGKDNPSLQTDLLESALINDD
ncbi:speckle-type POZ protein-like isoform X2 [Uloborus diversus]|nr:speckle-type POZ protein-like isoform X2 [Uloborus diversus]